MSVTDLPTPAAQDVPLLGHVIGGTQNSDTRGETLPVTSPWDGQTLAQLSLGTAQTVDQAVQAAQAAFPAWSGANIKKRMQVFFAFKALVEERIEELGTIISRENGKTQGEAVAEIQRGLEVVEYATSVPNLGLNTTLEVSGGVECSSTLCPLGVVAGITPFNFPAMIPMWMFPLAIVAGNTFILKPSEQVPMASLKIAEWLREAGLPDGVFNVVNGARPTVEALIDHPGIAAIGFVGSSKVAQIVYEKGTARGKRILALGGAKNHLVVVPDADVDITAANVVASANGCAGQRCMAASVLITVGDCQNVLDEIVRISGQIRVGADIGPVISGKARDRIVSYIDAAEKDGAKLLLDGRSPQFKGSPAGNWVGPTIIDGVKADAPCACDEIFGPVLTVLHVDTLDEALAIENANPYGNAASIYTSSGAVAREFTNRASAGMLGVNIGVPVPRDPFPFGGWNASKFGASDMTGADGLRFWTQAKKITSKWSASASKNWMS